MKDQITLDRQILSDALLLLRSPHRKATHADILRARTIRALTAALSRPPRVPEAANHSTNAHFPDP